MRGGDRERGSLFWYCGSRPREEELRRRLPQLTVEVLLDLVRPAAQEGKDVLCALCFVLCVLGVWKNVERGVEKPKKLIGVKLPASEQD